MRVVTNANDKIEQLLNDRGTISAYDNVRKNYFENDSIDFVTHLHILITRIGVTVNEILIEPKYKGGHYYKSIMSFLTKSILHDKALYHELRMHCINERANDQKHLLRLKFNNEIGMRNAIKAYNKLIQRLAEKLKIPNLSKKMIISVSKQSQQKTSDSNSQVRGKNTDAVISKSTSQKAQTSNSSSKSKRKSNRSIHMQKETANNGFWNRFLLVFSCLNSLTLAFLFISLMFFKSLILIAFLVLFIPAFIETCVILNFMDKKKEW